MVLAYIVDIRRAHGLEEKVIRKGPYDLPGGANQPHPDHAPGERHTNHTQGLSALYDGDLRPSQPRMDIRKVVENQSVVKGRKH